MAGGMGTHCAANKIANGTVSLPVNSKRINFFYSAPAPRGIRIFLPAIWHIIKTYVLKQTENIPVIHYKILPMLVNGNKHILRLAHAKIAPPWQKEIAPQKKAGKSSHHGKFMPASNLVPGTQTFRPFYLSTRHRPDRQLHAPDHPAYLRQEATTGRQALS